MYSKKAYFLGFQLAFMIQITGICGVVTQANNIVAVVIPDLAQYTGLVLNAVQLLGNLGTLPLLTRVGRKPVLLFANVSLGVIDVILATFFIFENERGVGLIIFILLVVYMIIFGMTSPVIWFYVPEIIPAKIVPLATMMNWFSTSLCIIITPVIM